MITDEQYGELVPEQYAVFFTPSPSTTPATKSPPVAERGRGPTHKRKGDVPDGEASKSAAGLWQ